jgi:hypothetical protein
MMIATKSIENCDEDDKEEENILINVHNTNV